MLDTWILDEPFEDKVKEFFELAKILLSVEVFHEELSREGKEANHIAEIQVFSENLESRVGLINIKRDVMAAALAARN